MSDTVIKVEGVSKKYCRSLKNTMRYGVSDLSRSFFGLDQQTERLRDGEFWAVNDVSFEVKRGEALGLIGLNGSGKSTLLKMLNGIMMPDKGRIEITGRMGALIEVGAGFHPMLTGRENIYINGAIIGMSKKEIDKKFDEIVDFAGIDNFIDSPVKHYSSGMYVRLGFAIVAHAELDILLVDEALSVGDAKYQVKCFRKFEEFKKKNKSILFVSHSTEQIVRHCDKAMLMNYGAKLYEGKPHDISNKYMDLLFGKGIEKTDYKVGAELTGSSFNLDYNKAQTEDVTRFIKEPSAGDRFSQRKSYNKNEYRWGNRNAEIVDYFVVSGSSVDPVQCKTFEEFHLYLKVRFLKNVEYPIYGLFIKTADGVTITGNNSKDWDLDKKFFPKKVGDTSVVHFYFVPRLTSGEYLLSVGVAEESEGEIVPMDRRYDSIHLVFANQSLSSGLVDFEIKLDYLM